MADDNNRANMDHQPVATQPAALHQKTDVNGAQGTAIGQLFAGKRVLLIVGLIAVVIVVIVVLIFTTTSNSKPNIEQSATEFIAEAKAENPAAIYDNFSDELKGMQTKDSLSAKIAALGLDDTCKFVLASSDPGADGKVTLKGTIECESKQFNAHFGYNAEGKLISYSIAPLTQ